MIARRDRRCANSVARRSRRGGGAAVHSVGLRDRLLQDAGRLQPGLDYRREFSTRLDAAPIAATARGLAETASRVTGERFTLLRAGGLRRLEKLIRVTRFFSPGKYDVYPPWQGMQYMHNMFDGRPKLKPLDNDRYPDLRWTSIRDVLSAQRDGKP